MLKYVIKRIVLMLFTFFIICTMCFMLIRMLPMTYPEGLTAAQKAEIQALWSAYGYDKPIIVQYGIYLRNIFTKFDFGRAWRLSGYTTEAFDFFLGKMPMTIMVNFCAVLISTPLGILLGIYAAIKKNKWQDSVISVMIMLFVSVPSYVYAFIVQYVLYFKLEWFPLVVYSVADAGGVFTWKMFYSMVPAIIALSFGEIAYLCRFTRAELTETLTSDYMLLARTKGLTRAQATVRHALKNAMVPILPMIISSFISIIGGSMIIEQIFSINGVGQLYIQAINQLDYDVFMVDTIFYTFVGLLSGIIVDLSYGFIDPRIRMGER